MAVKEFKAGRNQAGIKKNADRESVEEWFSHESLSFSPAELILALEGMRRDLSGAELPARDRAFWETNSGISAGPEDVGRSSANSIAARVLMDATSHTAAEVAERLGLSQSTIRHYRAERKLYSYLANGRLVFPAWQFTASGKAVPRLEQVLGALPVDLHPQAVAGFFLTPQADLFLHGGPATVKVWLEAGGAAEPVVRMAAALSAGY
ncbi:MULTISPECIES: helix-turn-helix domain-containing protein [Arthrobacter]|uniref:DNA-binding protein n=1 Tax=Arthrobacter terricola TaxID=2547396 RepID=A0A4R5KRL7_9MICC|nr:MULTISPECIES: helix-turn-helix domain-containing protein [Arthrobacter]MBT8160503.1 helix-turn-helix domain-containing protein [Arthrobacter sp. GN70]TDF98459.1 DNA-binding protein [Arthrobacter terricola]